MIRKGLSALILVVFVGGWLFAKEDNASREQGPKANVITVDLGPMVVGLGMSGILKALGRVANKHGGETDISGAGFGIGAQYERVFNRFFSAAGRFAYMGITPDIDNTSLAMRSFSIEGHGRVYPFGRRLYIDGMMGYANFFMEYSDSAKNHADRAHYFKFGGKLGSKKDFGKPGGLVFDYGLGYYGMLGGKDNEFEKIADEFGKIDGVKSYLDKFIFVGGPRVSLGLGWAF
jgi:hypothetical protein